MDIVRSYKPIEFLAIPKKRLIDFVHSVYAKIPSEVKILNNWERHFEERGTPFAIVRQSGGKLALMKERRAQDNKLVNRRTVNKNPAHKGWT